MKGLRFEWLGERHYRVAIHFGGKMVPVEGEILAVLAQEANRSPDQFLTLLVEKIGSNPYLRGQILRAAEHGDVAADITAMREFFHKHKI